MEILRGQKYRCAILGKHGKTTGKFAEVLAVEVRPASVRVRTQGKKGMRHLWV